MVVPNRVIAPGQWIGLLGSTRVVIEGWVLPVGSKGGGIILILDLGMNPNLNI